MSDLSSGMNILTDVYQRPELNTLCGFRERLVARQLAGSIEVDPTD